MPVQVFDPDTVTWEEIWEWLLQPENLQAHEETTGDGSETSGIETIAVISWAYPSQPHPTFVDP